MNENKYSNEEVVKAFKSFISKVIENAAIDYARKIKNKKYNEVSFSESFSEVVSLSNYDNDTFFVEKLCKINLIVSNFNEKDKKIFHLMLNGKDNKQISTIMNLSEKTIKNKKNLIRKKLKEELRKYGF
ncbi:MAG: sigma-70 family RNA polymerase sigma factor [Clostridia bacterium]|nr:sigma-70 family RNA polymerase sigma factor [Clostridia bacterium]